MLDGLADSRIEFNTVECRGDSVFKKLDDGVLMGRGALCVFTLEMARNDRQVETIRKHWPFWLKLDEA